MARPPALALIEFDSIASGTRATDALIKEAPVVVDRVGSLQPGKFAVLFSGEVASVAASYDVALRVGSATVADKMFLPHVDPSVYGAVIGEVSDWQADTLGIIETDTLAACIEAADVAVKGANVRVVQIRLGDELGGKGLAHFAGEQHDVEAAVAMASDRVGAPDRQLWTSVTPRYDAELRAALGRSTRFWGEGG